MEETRFELQSPTLLDNPYNRLREFVCYAAANFNLRASTEIMIAMDKKSVQTGNCAQYIGTIANVVATSGFNAAGVGPVSEVFGTITGLVAEKVAGKVEETRKHESAKIVEHYLVGFDPESEIWAKFILEAFADIFVQ